VAFLDFISNRNASQQQAVAKTLQPETTKPLTPNAQGNTDAHEQKLARAMRYVDASTRPRLPKLRLPRYVCRVTRHRGSGSAH
jgi:hypothetical protein